MTGRDPAMTEQSERGLHLLDDLGDVSQELVQVERLRCDRRHLEQEIKQLRPLAKTHRRFAWSRHLDVGQVPDLPRQQ